MAEVRTIHADGRFGKVVPVRLRPGTDVMDGLKRVCEEQGIMHGTVLVGIGSLRRRASRCSPRSRRRRSVLATRTPGRARPRRDREFCRG